MNFLSLFSFIVLATEGLISPLPDNFQDTLNLQKPTRSFAQLALPAQEPPRVLGVTSDNPMPTPTPTPRTTKKKSYTIALLGDSMIDTLGPNVPHLKSKLTNYYPLTNFNILNFGVGGENVESGLKRVTNPYTYLSKEKPSVVSQKPEIVIIESFGYNPFTFAQGALEKHWLTLDAIVKSLKENLPDVKIVIAATISPDSQSFGDGAPNTSFDPAVKIERTKVIKSYIENAIRYAGSARLPLANAYHPSLNKNGNGKEIYINQGDHIHYSDEGRNLFAQKVFDSIIANRLIE